MFESIGAVAAYVTDKERAKDFYMDVLGFELIADLGPTLCFLKSKSGRIDVYLEGGMKPGGADRETSRLGFFLHSEVPAAETLERLRRAGVRLLQEEPEPVSDDTACFQLLDPDGNVISVCGAR